MAYEQGQWYELVGTESFRLVTHAMETARRLVAVCVLCSGSLGEGFVRLVEMVGDRNDGEDCGDQARYAWREHEPVGKEGGEPHPEAELAAQQLAYGPAQSLSAGLL